MFRFQKEKRHSIPKKILGLRGDWMGEDFVDDVRFSIITNNVLWIGVAHGVGSWSKDGVDRTVFPCKFLNLCKLVCISCSLNAKQVLQKAFDLYVNGSDKELGSSTALLRRIALVSGMIKVSNIEDHCLLVLRGDGKHVKIVFGFNCAGSEEKMGLKQRSPWRVLKRL
jgi:hypothetical protein